MEWIAGYVAIGAAVGFFAGLLGIGGGAIMVPLLVMLFEAQGLPREHVLHLAVGSGMATILFTAASSARSHAARGGVRWDIVKTMTPGILLGGLLGSAVAGAIPTRIFAMLFCATVYLASANMMIDRKPKPSGKPPGGLGMSVAGFAISVPFETANRCRCDIIRSRDRCSCRFAAMRLGRQIGLVCRCLCDQTLCDHILRINREH